MKRRHLKAGAAAGTAILAGWPSLPARADIAVPVVSSFLGSQLWSLPLLGGVILLEALIVWALVGKRREHGLGRVLGQLAAVNLLSTLFGFAYLLFSPDDFSFELEPVFFKMLGLTIFIEFLGLFYFYGRGKRSEPLSRLRVLGLSVLINAPSYLLLGWLMYATYHQRTPRYLGQTALRELRTMVETYAVDAGGVYPKDLQTLIATAQAAHYWREPRIPGARGFFRSWPEGASLLLRPGQPPRPDSAGYRALLDKKGEVCGYQLYGYDHEGRAIKPRPGEFGSPCE